MYDYHSHYAHLAAVTTTAAEEAAAAADPTLKFLWSSSSSSIALAAAAAGARAPCTSRARSPVAATTATVQLTASGRERRDVTRARSCLFARSKDSSGCSWLLLRATTSEPAARRTANVVR